MDRARLKSLIFGVLGKEPEAVVIAFRTGPSDLADRMEQEIRALVPDRRHFSVSLHDLAPGNAWSLYRQLRRRFRRYRVGLAPVLFTSDPNPLRLAAFLLAPSRILAYNARLERHHLRLSTWLASLLFWRGVPLDRIWLRPWKRATVAPDEIRVIEGRPRDPQKRCIAVLSPYFPYPLSHGGAVRIFHLLREIAREFDVILFAFTEHENEFAPVAEFCSKIVLAGKPQLREPRWSSLLPPEVREYRSPAMRRALSRFPYDSLQVEYTQLAQYGGDVLVEHDVTFDLFGQVWCRDRTVGAWWDYFRWRRFETAALRRYRRVVVMSEKDADQIHARGVHVIENGVDLDRFRPEPEQPARRLLFIGSFRHFPNIAAYRYFMHEVWPLLENVELTVVCGPDHLTYWRAFTGEFEPAARPGLRLLGFVADVRPLYHETNLVIVPTTVSAGTNVKVLEAMAMERAVVSTPSGCAGLGLKHGESVWIADNAAAFAEGIRTLLADPARRRTMAQTAHAIAEDRFEWRALGEKQRALLRDLVNRRLE